MYKCENCKMIIEDYNDLAEDYDGSKICPHCNGDVEEVDECECGEIKEKDQLLCRKCQIYVVKQFQDFIDSLTDTQREYLNEFYDGKEF